MCSSDLGFGIVWKIPTNGRFNNSWKADGDSSQIAISPGNRWITLENKETTQIFDGFNPRNPPLVWTNSNPIAGLGFDDRSPELKVLFQNGIFQGVKLPVGGNTRILFPLDRPGIHSALLEPPGDRWIALTKDARLITVPARQHREGITNHNHGASHSRVLRPPPFDCKFVQSPDGSSFVLIASPQNMVAPDVHRFNGLWIGRSPFKNGSEIPLEFPGNCSSAAYSRDGRWIAAGTWDGAYRIFNAADGSPATPLRRQDAPIRCVTLDRSGRVLITGSTDRHIRFWDLQSGEPVAPDIEMQASVAHVQTIPSGHLLSLGNDCSVALWRADDWRPIFKIGRAHV